MHLSYDDLFIDFDDTLFDTKAAATASLETLFQRHALHEHFKDFEHFSDIYWQFNQQVWRAYALGKLHKSDLLIERFRLPLSTAPTLQVSDEFCAELSGEFLALNATKTNLVEGAKALVQYLRSRGYRLHICSNGFEHMLQKRLHNTGLSPYFNTIISSETAGHNKPSKLFFDYALAQSHAKIARTLMIGDSWENDIMGAQNCGMDSLFFDRSSNNTTLSKTKLPTFWVKTLKEIQSIL